MKTLFCPMVMFVTFSTVLAQTPFNGVYCGPGEVTIQGHKYQGSKVLEIVTTATELHFKRDHTDLDDGSYLEGRPEEAVISDGRIIYVGSRLYAEKKMRLDA